MFDKLYREAYEKLSNDIRHLVRTLMFDNEHKSHTYRDGLTEACEAFLRLASDSYGELMEALDREAEAEAEAEAEYLLASRQPSDDSSHEKQ